MRRRQAQGLIAQDLDPAQTLLSMVGAHDLPGRAFPQITRLLTGLEATDPEFRKAAHGISAPVRAKPFGRPPEAGARFWSSLRRSR
jgi:hypothetical protein